MVSYKSALILKYHPDFPVFCPTLPLLYDHGRVIGYWIPRLSLNRYLLQSRQGSQLVTDRISRKVRDSGFHGPFCCWTVLFHDNLSIPLLCIFQQLDLSLGHQLNRNNTDDGWSLSSILCVEKWCVKSLVHCHVVVLAVTRVIVMNWLLLCTVTQCYNSIHYFKHIWEQLIRSIKSVKTTSMRNESIEILCRK